MRPLIKKPSLDTDDFKNYRPVSNLKFVSKILEKVVASQITSYLEDNKLLDDHQSAYKKYHGTETALLKVQNDILQAFDNHQGVILVLLDLSSAFDTIDHDIMISRLRSLGIKGQALQWITSYLQFRTQSVSINGQSSDLTPLRFGVPQGSVLGPQFFTIYASPISKIAQRHGVHLHMYADDTQLYLPFKINNTQDQLSAKARMEVCILEIKSWMDANKLKLNDTKTELITLSSKYQQSKIHVNEIQVANTQINASTSVRNLGVMFDNTLSMDTHVKKICQSVYFQIRNVTSIRKVLSDRAASMVVHALIISRLDNGNSLLFGISQYLVKKLQHAQNATARVLSRGRKYDHITPTLMDLHWLPMKQRIEYKILLLTWKAIHDLAPVYIRNMLFTYTSGLNLRSTNKHLLKVPRTRSSYGDRSFIALAPNLWNHLPQHLRILDSLHSFQTQLKSHLFDSAYN